MNASKLIKYIIKKNRKSQQEVADLLKMNKKTLDNKFYRDNFEANDLLNIADVLGLTILFVDEAGETIFDTSKIIQNEWILTFKKEN